MENPNKLLLIISILTLLAVGFSYINLKDTIEDQDTEEFQAAPTTSVTISGVGGNVTRVVGGGNCSPTSPQVKAEASIVGGVNGNQIEVKAKCSLGGTTAVATSIDIGGPAVFNSGIGNPGNGKANCTPNYTPAAAGGVASTWTAVCTF
ncbi:hypothetical protein L0668_14775 [Paraglaciecola aquimarina]|uniref:Uncharacterized protein n=1 Tax=Paraglaciecola algarum TaxID=3050085 RepID=A0ABS9D8U5_9ALTE|nr:hypothetical protein [Paraglaciecola sp. G1-23]MCF2949381.1 hypothetical protein [Paraglaciecola sp. G1-23]